MAARIGLVCLAWWLLATTSGRLLVMGQCGGQSGWYGGSVTSTVYSEEPSSGDVSGVLSYEEESLEYYPIRRSVRHHHQQEQQQYRRLARPSRYTEGSSYGYGNDNYREGVRDCEKRSSSGRKTTMIRNRNVRRPVEGYSKSGRTDYVQQAPPETRTSTYGERRKANRATKYAEDDYGPAPSQPPHQTTSLSFKVLPPKPRCAQNLLIGCTPTVTRVPCTAATHGGYGGVPAPHYPSVPVHYNYHEPSTGYGYGPPPHGGYHQSPSAPPAPPAPPASEPYHQPGPAYHQQPPAEGPHGGYAPSYKMSSAEQFPGFAAPVREELSESPKLPVISAFSQQPPAEIPTTTVASDTAGAPAPVTTTTTTAPATTTVPIARVGVTISTATPAPASTGTTKDDFWNDATEESATDAMEGSTAR
ncbi:leucine-rich repeat extensin-like protein 1 [Anopheles albimanus]|uniref:leucine-rich repeat extensin-like protein 1 n=1 Tax=Anopheles albimanus TaxID=7167 RepID=UPI00163E8560|nr:leucine-rich repeat extensin-like protein 1 [Anopheles albimanus]